MPEFLQNLINRIKEWWGKYDKRQKIMMISAVAVVALTIGILVFVVTRPTWITIATAEDAKQAQSIEQLLSDGGYQYEKQETAGTFSFRIHAEDETDVSILLGSNNIPSTGYTINDVLDGSFTSTEADKQKKMQVLMEYNYKTALEQQSNIKSADVSFHIPDDDGTLIANTEPSYAKVQLELSDTMTSDQAAAIAKWIATGLGNDTTENITIIDTNGNLLFSGGDEATAAGIASSNQAVKREAEADMVKKVRDILSESDSGMAIYDNTRVAVNLDMNFDNKKSQDYHYYVDEGQTQGYLDSETSATSENVNGVAGVPGTDSNDDTTYVIQDADTSSSSTEEFTRDYLPSETITTTEEGVGKVNTDTSSISVVAYRYVNYDQEIMEKNGELGDQTFEQYAAANGDMVQTQVGDDVIQAIAGATGIPAANVNVLSYDVPMFIYKTSQRDLMDYLEIIMALLILAMLGFVVFRTLRRDEEEEVQEEVSVEKLLESQQEENLEEIGFNEKSEARLMIEKFVEENPDAAAALLRNWLNEDWG